VLALTSRDGANLARRRAWKLALIEAANPQWLDLADDLYD
jgi:predicted GIY-YIG superfamily endonuclease